MVSTHTSTAEMDFQLATSRKHLQIRFTSFPSKKPRKISPADYTFAAFCTHRMQGVYNAWIGFTRNAATSHCLHSRKVHHGHPQVALIDYDIPLIFYNDFMQISTFLCDVLIRYSTSISFWLTITCSVTLIKYSDACKWTMLQIWPSRLLIFDKQPKADVTLKS